MVACRIVFLAIVASSSASSRSAVTCSSEREGDPIADFRLRETSVPRPSAGHGRLVHADVHAEVHVTGDVEIEVGGWTASGRSALAHANFEHEALGEQLVDDRRDGGLGQRRAPRHLGAREWAGAAPASRTTARLCARIT